MNPSSQKAKPLGMKTNEKSHIQTEKDNGHP